MAWPRPEFGRLMEYVFKEFPKWKYHPVEPAVVVGHKEAEEALGPGWHNSPAGFCSVECEASHGDEISAPPVPVKKPKKVKA